MIIDKTMDGFTIIYEKRTYKMNINPFYIK